MFSRTKGQLDPDAFQAEAEDVEDPRDWPNPFDPAEDYLQDLHDMRAALAQEEPGRSDQ